MIAGRYSLEREIGRGGMGAVWIGRDQLLGRIVALKRVGHAPGPGGVAGSPDLRRAEREAKLAARLNHPHVVAVFDLVTEGDEQWLVMEYVEGLTLAGLVQRDGALSPDEAAPLIRQAAEALAAAHGAGVVHRDVKPTNLMVRPDGQVKLADFGIARAHADATLTQTGLVTGSPAYLAPEVASGATASEASDVWSLGATLYHALAGRPPYEVGENVLGALYRIVHEDPPRLAGAGWLAPLLESTMARDPDARWTMAEVGEFLGRGTDPTQAVAVPGHAAEPNATTVMPAVDRDPTPAAPIPAAPAPSSSPRRFAPATAAAPRRARDNRWLPVAAGAALVLIAVLLAVWLLPGAGDDDTAGGPRADPSTPTSSSPSPDTGEQRRQAMVDFTEGYLDEVTDDPSVTWEQLSPAFQRKSGGFERYQGFWSGTEIEDYGPVRADVDALTVRYPISYGNGDNDTVVLQLVEDGDDFLIDDELQ